MHIGLIGGIGPAATEFYYRQLSKAYSDLGRRLELTIVNADAHELVNNLVNGESEQQAEIFLRFVERLKAAGADAAVVTSLGGHFCIQDLEKISPLPLINILPILDRYFVQHKLKRIGILGTKVVMESGFYGGVTSTEIVVPDEPDETHDQYISMAKVGVATDTHREFFISMGRKLYQQHNADAIVLAGTDLCLVFDGKDYGYPVVDCAQVHVDELVAISTD